MPALGGRVHLSVRSEHSASVKKYLPEGSAEKVGDLRNQRQPRKRRTGGREALVDDVINIARDRAKQYRPEEDVTRHRGVLRGPLKRTWLRKVEDTEAICCIKRVTVRCEIGVAVLNRRLEKFVMDVCLMVYPRARLRLFCS